MADSHNQPRGVGFLTLETAMAPISTSPSQGSSGLLEEQVVGLFNQMRERLLRYSHDSPERTDGDGHAFERISYL